MNEDISQLYPEVTFWVLTRKHDGEEFILTHEQLESSFPEKQRLIRIKNGFDPYFTAYQKT